MGIPHVWAFTEEALENLGLLNDPTASGSVTYTNGKIGKAIDCANSDYIDFEDNDALNNDHHTICFWFNMTASSIGYEQFILGSPDNSSGNRSPLISQYQQRFHLKYTDIGTATGVNSGPANFGETSSTDFSLNTWYHITIVKNRSLVEVFINGSSILTYTDSNIYPSLSGRKLRIAAGNANLHLNDLRIYPSVLNKQEIKDISRGLVSHWKLNGDAQDGSGYNQHGTSTGVTWSIPDRKTDAVVNSNYGSFSQTDNSDIIINDASITRIKELVNQSFSISCWFRTSGYNNNGSVYNSILALNNVSGDDYSFGITYTVDHHLRVHSQSFDKVYSTPFTLNEWHHLVVTRHNDTLAIYLDGSLAINGTVVSLDTNETPVSSTFYIGRDAAIARRINGDISDVRIYSSVLVLSDVTELYHTRAKLSSNGQLKVHSLKMIPVTRGAEYADYIAPITTSYTIVSFDDANDIQLNGEVQATLSAYNTTSLAVTEGDRISANHAFSAGGHIKELIPASWHGYEFVYELFRNTNGTLKIFSVNEALDYEIFKNGVSTFTGSIAENGKISITLTTTGTYHIQTTQPVCIYVDGNNVDNTPLFPMREELFGIPSDNARFVSPDACNYTVYESDGTKAEYSKTANISQTHAGGSDFASPAVRIIADVPFFGYSSNTDGVTSFLPRAAMAHKFVLSETIVWITFVGLDSSCEVKVYNNSGSLIGTEVVTGGGRHTDGEQLPTHLKITTDVTYLNQAGWYFICSAPVLAYVQTSLGEQVLHGNRYMDYTTYSPFEMPSKTGVAGVEYINETGIDTDGLIFWAPFDNGPREISGNQDLTISYSGNGEPTRVNNMIDNGAYRFVNTSGITADYYIEYNDLPYDLSSELSVSVWVKFDQGSVANRETIFSWTNAFFVSHETDSKVMVQSYDNNSATWKGAKSLTSVSTDDWYHIVGVYDGTNYKIYINGVENNFSAHSITFDTGANQRVRTGDNTWGNEAFDGDICHCMIFKRAITAKEINTLYKMQSNNSAMQRAFDGSLVIGGISDANNG